MNSDISSTNLKVSQTTDRTLHPSSNEQSKWQKASPNPPKNTSTSNTATNKPIDDLKVEYHVATTISKGDGPFAGLISISGPGGRRYI